ncbi:BnaC03g48300D [Brassica napus]|uniref:BnaC03g48300D protein n=1 Tax=Brassica napus TaxID=3708 RepID=A0A078F3X5_BRANA|nr:BnaC03g48300D [Brassica napus]
MFLRRLLKTPQISSSVGRIRTFSGSLNATPSTPSSPALKRKLFANFKSCENPCDDVLRDMEEQGFQITAADLTRWANLLKKQGREEKSSQINSFMSWKCCVMMSQSVLRLAVGRSTETLIPSVVNIYAPNDDLYGSGILFGEGDKIITCGHVVLNLHKFRTSPVYRSKTIEVWLILATRFVEHIFLTHVFEHVTFSHTRFACFLLHHNQELTLEYLFNHVEITLNCGQTFRGVVADCDPEYDLALVKIETPTRELLSPAKFGVSKDVSVGDTVLSIRNPLAYAKSFSAGKISCVEHTKIGSQGNCQFYLQTDCALKEGNSGGPVVNLDGQVIGVIWAFGDREVGVGFAIPIDTVVKVMEERNW